MSFCPMSQINNYPSGSLVCIICEPPTHVLYVSFGYLTCNTVYISRSLPHLFSCCSKSSSLLAEVGGTWKTWTKSYRAKKVRICQILHNSQYLVSKYSQVSCLTYNGRGTNITQHKLEWIEIVIEGIPSIGKYCYRI